jgi:trehalose 6-phosphate synthase/phosphatase
MPGAPDAPEAAIDQRRLVVVSNRLPVGVRQGDLGHWEVVPASGGLVTALEPVLRSRRGIWVGWPGTTEREAVELLSIADPTRAYDLEPVWVSAEDLAGFYQGFSNEVLWPLFHDHLAACVFDPTYWSAYGRVNRAFAHRVAAIGRPGDVVWVHDYHLFLVGAELRARGFDGRLAFFLHIPFPSPDMFAKLPWRLPLLAAALAYDLVGFQTERDRANFLACARILLPGVRADEEGDLVRLSGRDIEPRRPVRVGAFPISIDYDDFSRRASSPAVRQQAAELRAELRGRTIVLGVDRLDYTKGLPQRLAAFRNLLACHPRLHRRVTLMQHLVPSREDVPMYREMRLEIEGIVGEINGRFSEPGWVPIHYFYHSLAPDALSAYYLAADIALVTPLKDGMNLVAKEFCASHVDERGVLILSEFAGAVCQIGADALTVNPFDVEQLAAALLEAFDMGPSEQRARMRRLRASIRRFDVYHWLEGFLGALDRGARGTSGQSERRAGSDARSASARSAGDTSTAYR